MKRLARFSAIAVALVFASLAGAQLQPGSHMVRDLRITVLSTMLADTAGIGEWGFAAVVEADGRRILFDTGARPQTVIANAAELKVNLADITDVVLSHHHGDHTGGLITLRRALAEKNPRALSAAHVGKGIFFKRPGPSVFGSAVAEWKAAFEQSGGRFTEYDKPAEIMPGVWFTGPVPRKYPERNWSGSGKVETPEGTEEDNVPEDMSMAFQTAKGIVVLSGCGHAGIVNTLEHVRNRIANAPVFAALGGFHLFQLDDEKLAWTASKLREFGVQRFLGAHCTGIEATYRIRQLNGMTRQNCAVAAVGAVFDLNKELEPGRISR
jgi:7,8-dihydropterin-6-yl-methyl-4-(beta-D-ribofuranosyl)aminobenzene 5'-phosphate synthase